ncbi:MAG: hypothetical protein NUV51_00655 [Sulfuricaulis sp.]|nr:hypothetical protein [Sulfuricaulis sp.]
MSQTGDVKILSKLFNMAGRDRLALNQRHREAPIRRTLENLERFTCSVVDWPTPMMSDAEMENWAQRYELHDIAKRGVRFITFLQCPAYWLKARH